jgi:hypothetical protein
MLNEQQHGTVTQRDFSMSSLLEKWHPVTHDFGLIRTPMPPLLSEFENWQRSLGIEYLRTEVSSSLADAFQSLSPLSNSKMRRLFVATRSDWVACFQNGIQGSDPFPAMSYLARHMGVLAMRVCCTPEHAKYPAVIWEVYAPEACGGCPPLGYRRVIGALNDGGRWVFEESGGRFRFEEVEHYTLRRKRDRFTRKMLGEYLHHFRIELFTDAFLCVDASTPAVRLQQVTKIRSLPEFTLEQIAGDLPWQRD